MREPAGGRQSLRLCKWPFAFPPQLPPTRAPAAARAGVAACAAAAVPCSITASVCSREAQCARKAPASANIMWQTEQAMPAAGVGGCGGTHGACACSTCCCCEDSVAVSAASSCLGEGPRAGEAPSAAARPPAVSVPAGALKSEAGLSGRPLLEPNSPALLPASAAAPVVLGVAPNSWRRTGRGTMGSSAAAEPVACSSLAARAPSPAWQLGAGAARPPSSHREAVVRCSGEVAPWLGLPLEAEDAPLAREPLEPESEGARWSRASRAAAAGLASERDEAQESGLLRLRRAGICCRRAGRVGLASGQGCQAARKE